MRVAAYAPSGRPSVLRCHLVVDEGSLYAKTVYLGGHQDCAGLVLGVNHGVRILQSECHRRLTEDVLAPLLRGHRPLAMKRGWVGHVDGLDRLILEDGPGIGQRRRTHLARDLLDPLSAASHHTGDLALRHRGIDSSMRPPHVPSAQYPDTHRCS